MRKNARNRVWSRPQSPDANDAAPQADVKPERLSAQDPIAARTTTDTLAEIKKRGTLRVGVALIVPWAMHDKDGNLIGFEVDVAKKMARDLGVTVEFSPDEFHYLIPDLQADRFDLIISGMSITTNRAMQVNFSAPYNFVDLTFVANKQLAGSSRNRSPISTSPTSPSASSTPAPPSTSPPTPFPTRSSAPIPKAPIFSPTCSMANSTAPSPIARARNSSPSSIPTTWSCPPPPP